MSGPSRGTLVTALLALTGLPSLALAQMEVEAFEPSVPAGAGVLQVEVMQPVDAAAKAVDAASPSLLESMNVTLRGAVRAETSVDTHFDSPRNVPLAENVAEARLRASIGLDVRVSAWLRLVLEGRGQVRFATQRSFDRAKAFFEPMLGEAFADVYSDKIDLRIGNQRIALGANAAMAPADALNPRDLRESFVQGELEDSILPVFAIRAQGELGKVSWLAAYAPFFTPHRYFVFGQDEALMQPGLGPAFDNRRIDPSIEDYVQDRVLETKRPVPFAGDLALRAVSRGRMKIGASWVWLNEKLPRVLLDSEVSSLATAQAAGRPLDSAAALSVANRFGAGELLGRGTYLRQHLFSLEGSMLLGPGQLDVDFSYTPRQTFIDPSFAPMNKSAITWVIGFSQASSSKLTYSVSYLGMAVPNVAANEQLLLIEPATAAGAARTGFFHLITGVIAYQLFDDRVELQLRAAFEPIGRSFSLGPRATYQVIERLKIWVAGEVYEGTPYTPFGYFSRNDKVLVGARYELF